MVFIDQENVRDSINQRKMKEEIMNMWTNRITLFVIYYVLIIMLYDSLGLVYDILVFTTPLTLILMAEVIPIVFNLKNLQFNLKK